MKPCRSNFWVVTVAGLLLLLATPGVILAARGLLEGSHGKKSQLPKSCRSCHQGMAMLVTGEESSCLPCHGDNDDRQQMERDGFLKLQGNTRLGDIGAELRKPYAHPTLEVRGVHQVRETLPEEVTNAARHAECVDCHNPHRSDEGKPLRGVMGKRAGNQKGVITAEYELCYKCHAESANLPGNATNKHAEFKTSNPSFHPVEGEGKNSYVISLRDPYAPTKSRPGDVSIITCSDCHGSDDPNAPKGPHGSANEGLLTLGYQMADGLPESPSAYALCYKCHDRDSILGDQSFPYHSQHIVGKITGREGTSCYTCHDAHGSLQYPSLIRFNEQVVTPTSDGGGLSALPATPGGTQKVGASPPLSGVLKYDARGASARRGACYLTCHGVEHNPKEY